MNSIDPDLSMSPDASRKFARILVQIKPVLSSLNEHVCFEPCNLGSTTNYPTEKFRVV